MLVSRQYVDEFWIIFLINSHNRLDSLILQLISSHSFVLTCQNDQGITILNGRNETYTSIATVWNCFRIEQVRVKSFLASSNSGSRVWVVNQILTIDECRSLHMNSMYTLIWIFCNLTISSDMLACLSTRNDLLTLDQLTISGYQVLRFNLTCATS